MRDEEDAFIHPSSLILHPSNCRAPKVSVVNNQASAGAVGSAAVSPVRLWHRTPAERSLMDFEYTGRHVDVTPALRAHVEEHFGKIDHLFPNSTTARAHIIIDVVKNRHIAEILLHWREHTLTAKDTNVDMYQALTRCIDKIEK